MPHYPGHLVMGAAALAAALAIQSFTTNRHVRRKLRLSVALLGAYALLNLVFGAVSPAALNITNEELLRGFERLAFAAGLINLLVVSLINPLRIDRVPDRFPAILQDFLVIGLIVLAGTFLTQQLIATSAVGAVVVGFALKDTLGNAFAGLAIQSEAPFHVGNWIQLGEFEGRVAEVTWRATKLRTKTGNFVIVPNNRIAQEAIVNYTEPAVPTRLEVEVGASYMSPPNQVKSAIAGAMRQVPQVLEAPAPDALLVSFDDSAVTYRARFWISDYEQDNRVKHDVRRAIYYAFQRADIEIPWPIHVEYKRTLPPADGAAKQLERERALASIDLFAALDDEQRRGLAARASVRTFGSGEVLVRQGHPGESMFVVRSGRVAVVVEPDGREVATIERGGYFGEMSLLTGAPRSATVVARADTAVLEIDAESIRALAAWDPAAMEQIGALAIARRAELDRVQASASEASVAEARATLAARMRKFLRFK